MPDNAEIDIDAPPEQPTPIEELEEERSYEQLGEELLARLDAIDAELASIRAELGGHAHEQYSGADHTHENTREQTEDRRPAATHPWFRPLREFGE